MANQSTSFWSSLQGILMGIAAVITAVTGLYVAMSGGSDSSNKENTTTVVEVRVPQNSPADTAGAGNSSTKESSANTSKEETTTPSPSSSEITSVTPTIERGVVTEGSVKKDAVTKDVIKKDLVATIKTTNIKPVQTLNKQALQTIANSPVTLDCALFPTSNTVKSLMSWSNYYQQQVVDANGVKARAERPCKKTIAYRAQAYCANKTNIEVSQALGTTMRLCHQAGISWRDAVPPTP